MYGQLRSTATCQQPNDSGGITVKSGRDDKYSFFFFFCILKYEGFSTLMRSYFKKLKVIQGYLL